MRNKLNYLIKGLGVLLVFIISITTLIVNNKVIKADEQLIKSSKSAILIEVETGKVLYEYNAHEKYEPASMTKIMTMKLVMDALKQKVITKEQILTTSEYASTMGGSQIFLSTGEQMKVNDLLKAMIIASANDAAVVLAEAISGNETFFVNKMNNEVKKLNLKNTNFSNVSGLPTDNHYSSSYDMAMIARELLLNYEEEIIPYTSTYEDYVRQNSEKPFWLVNTNKLVKHVEGIDGLKTGWTEKAGYCLTCTKKSNGMRLISVVMNCDNVKNRTIDTVSLLNYGFANYEKLTLIDKGSLVEIKEDVLLEPSLYEVITSKSISTIIKKGEPKPNVEYIVELDQQKIKNLEQYQIGKLKINLDNTLYETIDLELVEKPKKLSFFKLLIELLDEIF